MTNRPRLLLRSGFCAATLALLAACGGSNSDAVRTGPQAVHPSPSALAQRADGAAPSVNASTSQPATSQTKTSLSETLFRTYCLGKPNAAASERAVVASGKFNAPKVLDLKNIQARYATYTPKDGTNAAVTLVTGSTSDLQCSAGANGKGIILYEDGRIVRDQ